MDVKLFRLGDFYGSAPVAPWLERVGGSRAPRVGESERGPFLKATGQR